MREAGKSLAKSEGAKPILPVGASVGQKGCSGYLEEDQGHPKRAKGQSSPTLNGGNTITKPTTPETNTTIPPKKGLQQFSIYL
jgi:hypothetical protein